MIKGFFITITYKKDFLHSKTIWKSDVIEKVPGWVVTLGDSVEEAIELQKMQYMTKKLHQKSIPRLVTNKDGPMASGKITRFIQITEELVSV